MALPSDGIIDTHCHLYDVQFEDDLEEVIDRAKGAGVSCILMPDIDSTTTPSLLKLAEQYPNLCRWMTGLHPCSVPYDIENIKGELHYVAKNLGFGKAVAVGEIGIDLYWRRDNLELQQYAFEAQCQLALHYNLPVAVHSRGALPEVLEILTSKSLTGLRGVLHCFTGNVTEARKAIDHGFYLGIGGIITFKNNNLSQILKDLPEDFILLETDSPYLAPMPFRGKRNEPAYIKFVIQKLSEIWNCPSSVVIRRTTENACRLFSLESNL